jgi:hypothetical protein
MATLIGVGSEEELSLDILLGVFLDWGTDIHQLEPQSVGYLVSKFACFREVKSCIQKVHRDTSINLTQHVKQRDTVRLK